MPLCSSCEDGAAGAQLKADKELIAKQEQITPVKIYTKRGEAGYVVKLSDESVANVVAKASQLPEKLKAESERIRWCRAPLGERGGFWGGH
mgnify:CR=1 FL=1